MKIQTTAAALAIALTAAFAAPAAEARVAQHHKTSHASSGAMVKTGAKKTTKAKHKKTAKKGHKKAA
ncbi:MAG TPA: hypothetical protein VIN03_15240 [Roseateles sp.]